MGAGLSAGQRQRIALARAFLNDRPVLLLDEPTANLDGATEAAVVGAVRRLAEGRTVLLVVHRPALLPLADRVISLSVPAGPPGPAASCGHPGVGRTEPAAEAAVSAARAAGAARAEARGVVAAGDAPARGETRGAAPWESAEGGPDGAGERPGAGWRGPVGPGSPAADGECEAGSDSPRGRAGGDGGAEGAARVAGSARTEAPLAAAAAAAPGRPAARGAGAADAAGVLARVRAGARGGRGRFLLALGLGSLALISAVGLMAVSGWLISRASQEPPVLYLMVAVTATRAFGIGRAVFRYAERLVSHDAVLRVLAELRVAVYRRLERLAPAGLRETRRGDLLSRLVADVDAVQDYFLRWLLPVGAALVVSAASVGFTAWVLPEAGAVLAVGLLVAGVGAPAVSGALARRAERRLSPARGALSAQVVDLLAGTAELTVAGALPRRLDAVRRADGVLTRIARRGAAATGAGAGLSALVCGLTVAVAAWTGVGAVADGRIHGVWLAVVVLTPLAAFEAVAGLPLAVQHRQRVRRAAERVYEVIDAPLPVRDGGTEEPPESAFPLVVRGLSARHAGQRTRALDGFDLELRPGRRIAVVGPSGSGKTTLAQVLLRFLDAEDGTYTLAGRDATAVDGDAVRRLVGLCAQDAHIFDSSLRENLRLARPGAGDDELRTALAAARLLEWVDGLPDGLDTHVGELGARLSGGQRQRLALARALLADFPVLVLDEPAEHLDLPTADALTADLLTATRGRTTVLITHRLAGLEAVDEVIVLDGGRAVQRGTYGELAAVDGPFGRMLEREAAEAGPGRADETLPLRPGAPV
ncbi:transport ATP-binding protein CydC [Streptomyces himastatinicus ATCC 53653]|uniref:Transport ATP-binding protein CydC n=2 Tax=Streptomyces violaceusniger group TaxID=2839105 RepID=D9W8Q3_9ACTN|nr:transport ATP-binding protein CydC [Streptomyces himastatinicus ATCC 53653]